MESVYILTGWELYFEELEMGGAQPEPHPLGSENPLTPLPFPHSDTANWKVGMVVADCTADEVVKVAVVREGGLP